MIRQRRLPQKEALELGLEGWEGFGSMTERADGKSPGMWKFGVCWALEAVWLDQCGG